MIKSIKIDNFKSLVDFELPLSDFNCLVGLNGSGKSTVLQAIDFLSQLVKGDISGWLEKRQWDTADLNSKLSQKSNIDFSVDLVLPDGKAVHWQGSFNRSSLSCTRETLLINGRSIIKIVDGKITMREMPSAFIMYTYEGSFLSKLKLRKPDHVLKEIRNVLQAMNSLDLISPVLLRKNHQSSDGRLGLGGEKLAAYIHESGKANKDKLTALLKKVYHQLDDIEITALHCGSKELSIVEQFNGTKLKSDVHHINDGMLRLMAIFSQLTNENEFLLFDEIENGINPELIGFLMESLVGADHQTLITTHNPMVIKYLKDDVAKAGVIYLYKTQNGITKACKLFDIPSLKEKLIMMNSGEAFIDTDLTALYKEVTAIPDNDL